VFQSLSLIDRSVVISNSRFDAENGFPSQFRTDELDFTSGLLIPESLDVLHQIPTQFEKFCSGIRRLFWNTRIILEQSDSQIIPVQGERRFSIDN
jgi:hypothetical protein